MITLIASQKGGVGKSTLATNLVVSLSQQGKDVLLLDSDRQNTSSGWEIERRLFHPELKPISCVQKYGAIDNTLDDLAKRYDYIVVDAAGRDSEEMRTALVVCDTVIVPFRPSQPDLNTLPSMNEFVRLSRRINTKLKAYAVLNMAPTNTRIKEIEQSSIIVSEFEELILLNTIIYDRKVYRDAYSEGLGVTEMDGKSDSEIASRHEILALMQEVFHG